MNPNTIVAVFVPDSHLAWFVSSTIPVAR
jgi:hypothetical protein